jgi:hypothetical protein
MGIFKFDENDLVYKKTNILKKYKAFIGLLLIIIISLSFSSFKMFEYTNNLKKEIILKEKELNYTINKIDKIREPISENKYVEDLYNNIGFNLNPTQFSRFEYLSLKYKKLIDEKQVPATLVWWVAYKESNFKIEAQNKESSAKGMFQFIDGTWNLICKIKGYKKEGRFDEEKQVLVMLDYLNYLYNKHQSWSKVMNEYHGGEYQYPVTFLFK